MKRIFKTISAVALGLSLLTSCDRTDDLAVLEQKSDVKMEATAFPKTTFVITKENKDGIVGKIEFTKPTYTYTPDNSVISQLEIALAGTAFKDAVPLGSTTSQSFVSLSYADLNSALLQLGVTDAKPTEVEVRLKSGIKNTDGRLIESSYSDAVKLTVTPYLEILRYEYTDWYLIGNAVVGNWDNKADNHSLVPLLKSDKEGEYTFTGYIESGNDKGFKIIKTKGNWDVNYGGNDGTLKAGGDNFSVSASGYYKVTINLNQETYTITKVAEPTMEYETVGIIGSATEKEWNESTPMKKSSFDPHLWILENVTLKEGKFKFRANNSWDVNWGGTTEFFGTATKGGNDIKNAIEAKYHIYFNDATGDYTVIPVE